MSVSPHPPASAVRRAVRRALEEDLTPLGDLSAGLLAPSLGCRGILAARGAGVVAGVRCAAETFAQVDPQIEVTWAADDGERVEAGAVLGTLRGPLASVLTAERTALNFLGHLSGIATLTARVVEAAAPLRVWDTRKTTPGLRALEKAAVRAGGGRNHRGNLSEWVMIKDNHLAGAQAAGTDLAALVVRAREAWPGRLVHVECDTLAQAVDAVGAGADALLLDNMAPEEVRRCVSAVDESAAGRAARPLVEISGGITVENVRSYAGTGADLVSMGALTNAAPVLDIGLDLEPGGAESS